MFRSNGKREVVAPTSAPILQIVAFPVADKDAAPGPKYSMMAFVPPFTVRIPASFKITSFGDAHPLRLPVSLHLSVSAFSPPIHTCHHIHCVSAAYTDGNHPQTTRIWRMRVRTNHHTAGKSIVLKHYLMDNAGSRFPETDTVLVGNGF